MKTAIRRLLLTPIRFSVMQLFRMGQVGWAHWFDDPNTLYRRRNRLTYTRDFSNAVWLKSRCTAAAPAGGFTTITEDTSVAASHYWYRTAESAPVGTYGVYTLRVKKSATRNYALWVGSNVSNPIDGFRRYVNLSTGGTTSPIIDGTGVVEISTTVTEHDATTWLITCVMQIATGGTAFGILNCLVNGASPGNIFYTGDGTSSIQAGYAQLETYTTTATEYQDVPTTWPEAYLAAVGAENIFAWTDNAGTTPVTAVGDTIGLSLDRAYGGYRDVELITNGDSEAGPAVSPIDTLTRIASKTRSTDYAYQGTYSTKLTSTVGSGTHYWGLQNMAANVTVEVSGYAYIPAGATAGQALRAVDTSDGSFIVDIVPAASTNQWVAFRFIRPAKATAWVLALGNNVAADWAGGSIYLDSVSMRYIPGTHLIQATGTARPTLSARVNGLVGTEGAFSGASWTKVGSPTITLTAGAGPRGESADLISNLNTLGVGTSYFFNANLSTALSGASVGSSYVPRIQIKRVSTSGTVTITNPSTSANGQWNINLALLSNSWEVITATHAAVTVVAPFSVAIAGQAGMLFTASATSVQFYCTQADVRTADDAAKNIPAYQRVGATAADHDTDGFPHGQYPDGTDDNQTTTTGGGGTTGFFYCGAITVSGDAGTARTIWSDTGTNTGYRVRVNSSNKLELAAGNGTAYTTVQSNETITAPGTYILSAWDDGGVLAVQVNNFAAATTTRPTVSAGTSTVTMYKDNGAASSYLNGRDYGSVYRQTYPGETAHNRLKSWLARNAGITV